jgi:hypothetical protein
MTDVYSSDAAGVAARTPKDGFQNRFPADAHLIAMRQDGYPIAAAVGALANGVARRGNFSGWLRRLIAARKGITGQ